MMPRVVLGWRLGLEAEERQSRGSSAFSGGQGMPLSETQAPCCLSGYPSPVTRGVTRSVGMCRGQGQQGKALGAIVPRAWRRAPGAREGVPRTTASGWGRVWTATGASRDTARGQPTWPRVAATDESCHARPRQSQPRAGAQSQGGRHLDARSGDLVGTQTPARRSGWAGAGAPGSPPGAAPGWDSWSGNQTCRKGIRTWCGPGCPRTSQEVRHSPGQ